MVSAEKGEQKYAPSEWIDFLVTFLLSPFCGFYCSRFTHKGSVVYSQALRTMWRWHHYLFIKLDEVWLKLSYNWVELHVCNYPCNYMCVHTYRTACSHVSICMHVNARHQQQMPSLHHYHFVCCLRQSKPGAHQLATLDGQQLQISDCLWFPISSARVIDIWCHAGLSYGNWAPHNRCFTTSAIIPHI